MIILQLGSHKSRTEALIFFSVVQLLRVRAQKLEHCHVEEVHQTHNDKNSTEETTWRL